MERLFSAARFPPHLEKGVHVDKQYIPVAERSMNESHRSYDFPVNQREIELKALIDRGSKDGLIFLRWTQKL